MAAAYADAALANEIQKYSETLSGISTLATSIRLRLNSSLTPGEILEIAELERDLKKKCEAISWHTNSLCWARDAVEKTRNIH